MKTRLLLFAALTGLLASLATPWFRPARILVAQWRQDLATLPAEQIPVRLQQLGGLGQEGMAIVVRALDDPREIVAKTARQVLNKQLDRWQTLELRVSSPRVAQLARLLAASRRTQGPAARQVSAELATRVLLWPIDRSQVDGARLVLDCELVLRAARESTSSATVNTSPPESRGEAVRYDRAATDAADQVVAVSAGIDLPIEIAAVPLPRRVADQFPNESPQQLFRPPAPPVSYSIPGQFRLPDAPAGARRYLPRSDAPAAGRASPASPRTFRTDNQPVNLLPEVKLMQQLHDPGDAKRGAAAQELRRRGFQSVHLNIAHKMFDPDPRERAKLIESLPRIPGIDARPWLLQLTRDDDPALRRQVIAIIATANDPTFLQRLQEMEIEETDPETVQLVRKILHR